MAIYTTCKNNTFNGMPLPPIWLLGADGSCRELVHFGYQRLSKCVWARYKRNSKRVIGTAMTLLLSLPDGAIDKAPAETYN